METNNAAAAKWIETPAQPVSAKVATFLAEVAAELPPPPPISRRPKPAK